MDKKKQQMKDRIETDPDFINAPRFDNSMKKALAERDGFGDRVIAQMLQIKEKEVKEIYQSAILKLRAILGLGKEGM